MKKDVGVGDFSNRKSDLLAYTVFSLPITLGSGAVHDQIVQVSPQVQAGNASLTCHVSPGRQGPRAREAVCLQRS
jgi:hypothetical protein